MGVFEVSRHATASLAPGVRGRSTFEHQPTQQRALSDCLLCALRRGPAPQGAPYGYAPLCDGNSEMDGFRFWKTGFWLDHLQVGGLW